MHRFLELITCLTWSGWTESPHSRSDGRLVPHNNCLISRILSVKLVRRTDGRTDGLHIGHRTDGHLPTDVHDSVPCVRRIAEVHRRHRLHEIEPQQACYKPDRSKLHCSTSLLLHLFSVTRKLLKCCQEQFSFELPSVTLVRRTIICDRT